jgi:hypothetical protein
MSYPCYMKFAQVGDSMGFKHIDINIPELLGSARGENLVQAAVALDDEWEGWCTLIVPGFHKPHRVVVGEGGVKARADERTRDALHFRKWLLLTYSST